MINTKAAMGTNIYLLFITSCTEAARKTAINFGRSFTDFSVQI